MNFATFKTVMAAWGLLGAVCTAGMFLWQRARFRRAAPAQASLRRGR